MQVVMLVLNKTECLEELLEALLENGIHGGTVLDSTGMMRVIDQSGDDLPMSVSFLTPSARAVRPW